MILENFCDSALTDSPRFAGDDLVNLTLQPFQLSTQINNPANKLKDHLIFIGRWNDRHNSKGRNVLSKTIDKHRRVC